jgi:hypothetical protein
MIDPPFEKEKSVMANTNSPFGFSQYSGTGSLPTYEQVVMSIASANSTAIYYGDPVAQLSTGYISTVSISGSAAITGIFVGCKYLSVSQKRTVWSNYWPGSDANGDVTAYVITDPNAQFIVQTANSNTTATAVGLTNVGNNIGFAMGTGNTANGISGADADQYTINTTSTLPFRIVALANYTPGSTSPLSTINGNDPTTAYNRIIVTFNNASTKSLTGI